MLSRCNGCPGQPPGSPAGFWQPSDVNPSPPAETAPLLWLEGFLSSLRRLAELQRTGYLDPLTEGLKRPEAAEACQQPGEEGQRFNSCSKRVEADCFGTKLTPGSGPMLSTTIAPRDMLDDLKKSDLIFEFTPDVLSAELNYQKWRNPEPTARAW